MSASPEPKGPDNRQSKHAEAPGEAEPLPGMTGAVTLATDGGIQVNSSSGSAATVVNVLLVVDNTTFVAGRQYIVSNNTGFVGITNWSFTTSVNTLSAGLHTFKVFAQYAGGSATAWVGGAPGSLLQGALTVTVLNK